MIKIPIKASVSEKSGSQLALYNYCFPELKKAARKFFSTDVELMHVINGSFIKIIENLHKYEPINFNAWIKRICTNESIDYLRKNKKYNTQITKSDSESELDFYSTGSSNDAVSNLGVENITALIGELPAVTGKVFNLYVIDGYAHKEIAEMLEMSEGTSKWHLSTARKMLRDKLDELENNNQRMVI